MSKRHNILPTITTLFISSAGKIEDMQEFKIKLLELLFIANGSHVKKVWLHVIVFWEHGILHILDNVYLFKYYPMKVPQNCFNYFNCSNQACIQVSKFSFALDK